MNIKSVSTDELIREIKNRQALANKEKTKYDPDILVPYIFMYSKLEKRFESNLVPVFEPKDLNLIKEWDLRARLNSHREIEILGVRLKPKEALRANDKLDVMPENILRGFTKKGLIKIYTV